MPEKMVNGDVSPANEKLATDPRADFPEERPGWNGYIEWEKHPERKQRAMEILKANKHKFEGVSCCRYLDMSFY